MIEKLTNNWDRENKNRIDRNFENLGRLDLNIMEDILNSDPSDYSPKINGKLKEDMERTTSISEYGTNITAEVNGVITRAWVYSSDSINLGLGIAEQEFNDKSTAIIKVVEKNLKTGWNEVELNFPVEQNKSYTLFKRDVGEGTSTGVVTISGWNSHPFLSEGLKFNGGKVLDETGSYTNYTPFFEIEMITSPAQLYKIMNDSVKPKSQFYVGDTPPDNAQFWFKPVGD